jgi:HlyD family secretion protein
VEKTNKNKIFLAVVATAALLVAALSLRPDVVEVDSFTVDRGRLVVTVQEQGMTRSRYRYAVSAPVTGRLLRSGYIVGDPIEAGDILATIAPPPQDPREGSIARSAVKAAEAHQREAAARLEEALSNFRRATEESRRRNDLYERELIGIEVRDLYAQTAVAAGARLDRARATLAAANAELEASRARLLGIDANSDSETAVAIPAPVSGTLLRIYEESERVLAAGSPLFELGENDTLEIVIDLLTEEAINVRPGAPVTITGWGGDKPLEGIVRYVEPGAFTKISTLGVEEQRVNVIGDLIDPPPGLGAEYRVEAAIQTWSADNVLKIPLGAVFRRRGGWHTFVVDNGTARLRPLQLGQRSSEYAEVLEGLEEGSRVILYPSDLIDEGVKVRAVKQQALAGQP